MTCSKSVKRLILIKTCSKSTKFKKQPIEKQEELKEKARQYHKNRYRNLMVAVN